MIKSGRFIIETQTVRLTSPHKEIYSRERYIHERGVGVKLRVYLTSLLNRDEVHALDYLPSKDILQAEIIAPTFQCFVWKTLGLKPGRNISYSD
jgi:hypothetical protein